MIIDIYRGRIAYWKDDQWFWAELASGYSAVARPGAPNEHHAICRNGHYGHIVPTPYRLINIIEPMSADEITRIDVEKFGFFETIDMSEDE